MKRLKNSPLTTLCLLLCFGATVDRIARGSLFTARAAQPGQLFFGTDASYFRVISV
jgi:hypothetical protein